MPSGETHKERDKKTKREREIEEEADREREGYGFQCDFYEISVSSKARLKNHIKKRETSINKEKMKYILRIRPDT